MTALLCRFTAPILLVVAVASAAAQTNDEREHTTCPQMPTLHCKNGSQCEEGVADFGRHHDHLSLQTHESGWYCKCIDGYIGHECGIQVDDCEGGTGYDPSDPTGVLRSCYHGSSCIVKDGNDGFYCDCDALNARSGPTAQKYAGMMCQHESTSLCAAALVGESAPNGQFCTNHGKCVKMVLGGEPHPGCECRDGWIGDRCEERENLLASAYGGTAQAQTMLGNVASKILFSLLILAMGCVSTYIIVIVVRARKSKGRWWSEQPANARADELNPDGSGTLGSPPGSPSNDKKEEEDADEGDLEMTANEEDAEKEDAKKEEGTESAVDEPEEPEIV